MKCSNCDAEVTDVLNTLVVVRGNGRSQIAVICKTCETGVLTMKIVLARPSEKAEFEFDGYLPVSSVK